MSGVSGSHNSLTDDLDHVDRIFLRLRLNLLFLLSVSFLPCPTRIVGPEIAPGRGRRVSDSRGQCPGFPGPRPSATDSRPPAAAPPYPGFHKEGASNRSRAQLAPGHRPPEPWTRRRRYRGVARVRGFGEKGPEIARPRMSLPEIRAPPAGATPLHDAPRDRRWHPRVRGFNDLGPVWGPPSPIPTRGSRESRQRVPEWE